MRKSVAGVVSIAILVAACSGFGSEEGEEQTNVPPPSTPDENSKPPPDVPGKPIEGIYVSAKQGKAGATGYPGSPVPTIAEGMKIARDKKLRLIVCAEEYAENFEVLDGVSAYGYYDCSAPLWKRTNDHAKVRAPKSPAMIARDIKLPTRIEGFDVFAPDLDGTTVQENEGSSIGFEARSIGPNLLSLSDSVVHGGKAAAGADGAAPVRPKTAGGVSIGGTPGHDQSFSSCDGSPPCFFMRVPGVTGPAPQCEFGEPAPGPGGNGGDGVWFVDFNLQENQPYNDIRGKPLVATIGTAAGAQGCETNATNCRGSNGAEAAGGLNGPNGTWSFDANGFLPGTGARGGSGTPGQGGGGGGGAPGWIISAAGAYGNPNRSLGGTGFFRSARGGSGGSGGCAGMAGMPGGGGGASVAALTIDAQVRFERVALEPAKGGRAGSGTLGSLGLPGGSGGPGGIGAGAGGDGGRGGPGGSSGHGAAGPSIALVWKGVRPSQDASCELRQGTGGDGRAALSQVVAPLQTIPAMPTGEVLAEYEIKP